MKQNGFTLLEILITAAIAATVGILIAQVFFTTTRSNTKTELLKDLRQNGQYALDIIERMLRNAISIESLCEEAGTSHSSIAFTNPDGYITTIECRTDTQGVTRIASTSAEGVTEYLTNGAVTIGGASCADLENTLQSSCSQIPGQMPKISVGFSLGQAGSPVDQFEQGSVSFQTTITARN